MSSISPSSSLAAATTGNETTATNENDISAHVSIVRDGRVTSPPWAIVETLSSSSLLFAAVEEEEAEKKEDDFVFAFSLAPGGLGRLTIVNAFGWSYYSSSSSSSVNGEVDLRYFLDVRAVASSSAVAVSVQNHTYRAKVGFLALSSSSSSFSSEAEGNSTTTANPTTTSLTTSGFGEYSFPLQRAADAGLVNFNAVSFEDESNVGGDVLVRSVRLRASSSGKDEGDGPTPTRGTFATTNQAEGGALLLPAFEDAIVENVGNESGVIGGEEEVAFLFDAKDEDSEKALIIGISVTCALLLAVLVVVGYFAKKRIKKGKHFTDRSEIGSEDRAHAWVQHLERLHSKSSLGGESAAFDATTTTTTHSRPFTPLSWKTSLSKRRSSGEGGNIEELENETVVHISGEIDNDEKNKEKKTNKEKSSEARRLMAPASAKKPPSTLEIPVCEDVVRHASTKPPKSNISSSLPTTEESPRGGIDRLQLLRRSTKDTTPAHSPAISRQNSLLNSIDGDMENATETRISLDVLAKEIQKLQESIQNDTNSSKARSRSRSRSSSSSSSKLELTPDKEDEVPFENLTEVELEKDVRIYERLGGGAYGTVYRGKFREREVAIKTLRVNALPTATSASTITPSPSNDEEVSEDIKMLKSEVEILRLAKHENIVSIFAACFTPIHKALLIVQLVHGGSLNEMLHRENNESVKLSGSLLKTILLDVAKAMEYLHGLTPRKILHRDLKPQNVLVEAKVVSDVLEKRRKRRGDDDDIFSDNIDDGDTAPTLKYKAYVCDFGISRLLPLMANTLKTSTSHTNAGTANYMAPELITNHYPCSTKADVFSFGNIVYECATGRIPFEKESHLRITYLVGMQDKRAEILPEDEVRGDVSELIKTCWKTDPKERPSFAEIVQTIARFPTKKNFDETKEE